MDGGTLIWQVRKQRKFNADVKAVERLLKSYRNTISQPDFRITSSDNPQLFSTVGTTLI